MANDKLQIGLDQLSGDVDKLNDSQDVTNLKLLFTAENYDGAKEFIINQMEKNEKLKKRFIRAKKLVKRNFK